MFAGAIAVVAACGSSTPSELGDNGRSDAGPGSNFDASVPFGFDASQAPPQCPKDPDSGFICDCIDQTLLNDVPNIYFFLDRSGSMLGPKWTSVRIVTADTAKALGPRANIGLALFPDPRFDGCAPGIELMPTRPGDAPAGVVGPTYDLIDRALNRDPSGGTPTAETLTALLPKLQALAGRTYAILATDGGPNCNSTISCSVDQCIPNIESSNGCVPHVAPNCCDPSAFGPGNCIDEAATVAAVAAYAKANIPLYVIGVPGSAFYSGVLDQLATAGGTARASEPLYYRVDTADAAAFASAMSAVAAKITASCTLTLKAPPVDPGQVNVWLGNDVLVKEPVNGWSLSGATVTLLGKACQDVLTGAVLDVRVIAGCPTIVN